jgi:hypothetical protein
MTDEEAIQLYDELKSYWGDKLPDPEVYPKQFTYYFKLYRYKKAGICYEVYLCPVVTCKPIHIRSKRGVCSI